MNFRKIGLIALAILFVFTALSCTPDDISTPNPTAGGDIESYEITGVDESATMHIGATLTINPTVNNKENVAFLFVSSDPSVVKTQGRVITAVGLGTAVISVTADSTEEGLSSLSHTLTVFVSGHEYAEIIDENYLVSPATCTTDAVYYKSCAVCKSASEETFVATNTQLNHEYAEIIDEIYLVSPATCTTDAVYYKSCSVCKSASEETFVAVGTAGHKFSEWIDRVEPDEDDGAVGHYECSECHEWFDDEYNTITEEERILPAHVTLTIKCYAYDELIFTTTKSVKWRATTTVSAPKVDYYDNSEVAPKTIKPEKDTEVIFSDYTRAFKVIRGALSPVERGVKTSSADTLALFSPEPMSEGTITSAVTVSSYDRAGIVFNYVMDGEETYYYFYSQRSSSKVVLSKITDGVEQILQAGYLSDDYRIDTAVEEKVVIADGVAYCYFWNSLIAVEDVGTDGGLYGVAADTQNAVFSDFAVQKDATVDTADTVMFGHSYFAWWNNKYYDSLSDNMAAINATTDGAIGTWANIAISGTISKHWKTMDKSIIAFKPKLGICMIGVSDLTSSMTATQIANNVLDLLLAVKTELPQFKAVIMCVNRCVARTAYNDKIADINAEFKTLAATYDWIEIADIELAFCDGDGKPISALFSDGLHPTKEAYSTIITPAIISALNGEN
jgi:lysophospholipase L1-like esterase